MTEEINEIINEFKESNNKSLTFLDSELRKIRTGKATPDMLDGVLVEYYGSMTELSKVANIGTLDGRTLTVQPWEKNILGECAKAIINANLGLAPQDNGEMLIINIPMLTEERRKELAKIAKSEGEHAKVSIRNNRKDAMDFVKELKNEGLSEDDAKNAEGSIQEVTDQFVKKIDSIIELKEKDIMTV
ncbi:ribosome recycling factor [Brumimicrobium aurantiacum]|uniref:Ribosome-recycling factor n=1 Tax=Brumimicrobium aurantiacum TaxID=1737063 RepID=A0A3E1EYM0_9FLAO|nr:ribosome recycling factor [Brumimicrobium aurantiacum]RFC54660.1 ribosome recycling factor [Brumimicrobium aurantiacum]